MDTAIIMEMEHAYKRSFANTKEEDWGYLYWNENNPSHWDANHAWVLRVPENHGATREQVEQFYEGRGIAPRFYIWNLRANQDFMKHLQMNGYRTETSVNAVQIWGGTFVETVSHAEVTVEPVTDENYVDALHVECSMTEFGGREVREKAFEREFHSPLYTHFLMRVHGHPAGIACLFMCGRHARVESVGIVEAFRGRGLVKPLLRRVQEEARTQGCAQLWVFPIDEVAERIYQKCGFATCGRFESAHAYRDTSGWGGGCKQ
ncbi:GNAT family N-acetyltransferase [Alicyclobacillus kakegawensis]|uniref:GNAT family N-acetyltransferase n=1 Tax=Alicyclobacillus kakegawensis TaxID=392012 RepID=UPI000829B892|nr:GNAT family N-acetyltransferase [Alicyclobacillus kakegawensis]